MVTKRKQHSSKRPVKQGRGARAPRPNKIGASTPYHFRGKNLTPYGGLLPVATTRHDGTGEDSLQSLSSSAIRTSPRERKRESRLESWAIRFLATTGLNETDEIAHLFGTNPLFQAFRHDGQAHGGEFADL